MTAVSLKIVLDHMVMLVLVVVISHRMGLFHFVADLPSYGVL